MDTPKTSTLILREWLLEHKQPEKTYYKEFCFLSILIASICLL